MKPGWFPIPDMSDEDDNCTQVDDCGPGRDGRYHHGEDCPAYREDQ